MKYHKGTQFTKQERKAILTMLQHATQDMDYGTGGSYTADGSNGTTVGEDLDVKEFRLGQQGAALVYALIAHMDASKGIDILK